MSQEQEGSSSLHFLSTQIQSRYDDNIECDRKTSLLQRFKNPTPTFEPPPQKITKKVKRSSKSSKPSKKSAASSKRATSLSAFVRETIGNRSKGNTQSILDFFSGDKDKAEDFLGRIEAATSKPHPLSKSGSSPLFSESEWRSFLDSVKLKFPSLSRTNHKTLKMLTRRIHEMRQNETVSNSQSTQDLDMWSQASRQPSDQLSAEDMKWLYDLDEEQVANDVSEIYEDEDDQGKAFFVTLSQVLDGDKEYEDEDEVYDEKYDHDHIYPEQLALVPDSESEPEELDPEEYTRLELTQSQHGDNSGRVVQVLSLPQISPPTKPDHTQIGTQIPSHQVPESLDILTSISFPPTCKKEMKATSKETEIFSSPPKLAEFKTPQNWANNLAITSSPATINESPRNQKLQIDSQFLSPVKYSPEEFLTAPTGLEVEINSSPKSPSPGERYVDVGTPTRSNEIVDVSIEYQHSGSGISPVVPESLKNSKYAEVSDQEVDHHTPEVSPGSPERLSTPTPVKAHGPTSLLSPTQDSDFSLISPIKRKSYITSSMQVYGKVEFQTQTSRLRLTTVPDVSLDDVIPDSEDEEGEVSIIEISRQVPDLDRQTSILQVPSSP